jgi:hypothetical protein
VGGLILVGLSAAVRSLSRIAERLDIQPLPLPAVAAVGHEAPAPRPVRLAPEPPPVADAPRLSEVLKAADAPAAPMQFEPIKASEAVPAKAPLLGWFGRPKGAAAPDGGSVAEPPREAPAAQDGANETASDRPGIDLAALARPPAPLLAPEPAPVAAPPPVRPAPRPAPPAATPPAQKAGAPQNGTAATTVYRSGVIDGMAYSLFMDGSIEAELPTGRVRFGTIDELQKYLVSRR